MNSKRKKGNSYLDSHSKDLGPPGHKRGILGGNDRSSKEVLEEIRTIEVSPQ